MTKSFTELQEEIVLAFAEEFGVDWTGENALECKFLRQALAKIALAAQESMTMEELEGKRLYDIGSDFACPKDYYREAWNGHRRASLAQGKEWMDGNKSV